MRRALAATTIAALLIGLAALPVAAQGSFLVLRYQAFDARGKAGGRSSLVLRGEGKEMIGVYREDGSVEQRVAFEGDARSLRARFTFPDGAKAFSAAFQLAEGRVLVQSEPNAGGKWKPALRDGSASLYFLLPRLLDLRAGASKTAFTIMRAVDGMRATFILECGGLKKIRLGTEVLDAYEVRMEPADFLIRLVWPYSNHYYFRASDLIMVRFEGPDSHRRMGRMDLLSVEGSLPGN